MFSRDDAIMPRGCGGQAPNRDLKWNQVAIADVKVADAQTSNWRLIESQNLSKKTEEDHQKMI